MAAPQKRKDSMSTPTPQVSHHCDIASVLRGLSRGRQLARSLQGSIWTAFDARGQQFVVKVTSKLLYAAATAKIQGIYYRVQEDVLKETQILRYLTVQQKDAPSCIVKFAGFFESPTDYYLIMEYGGSTLFEFVLVGHRLIAACRLEIDEWRKCVKIIYRQLMGAIRYLHSKNVCHFDVSLQNVVINAVHVTEDRDTRKLRFMTDNIRIKLIDFGLADLVVEGAKSTKFVGKGSYKSPEVLARDQRRGFDARANDIFCSGVCLFCMIFGFPPWNRASKYDQAFVHIFNNQMLPVVQRWNRSHYITADIVNLLSKIFKYESERISLNRILQHRWLNNCEARAAFLNFYFYN